MARRQEGEEEEEEGGAEDWKPVCECKCECECECLEGLEVRRDERSGYAENSPFTPVPCRCQSFSSSFAERQVEHRLPSHYMS